ncbi:MAG: fibronectin type III domain-containing protein, partial [Thermoanaerobaculia bacterium]
MCKWVVCCVALVAATVSAAIPANERDALIAFYNATGGAEWSERTNWLGAAGSECAWFGVTCNEAQTSVVELDLGGNALRGTFPIAALRGLPSLRELWLSQNELTGPLQPEIRDLRTLQLLDLGDNPIGGTIPPQIAEMPNLTALGLYEAELTGEIPIELWRMSALVELLLRGNELTGSIPSQVSALRNIEYLSIEENQLSGAIPLELTTLTNLVQLWLGFNEFEGSIPPQLAQLQRLELLTLWGNRFSGTIPRELAQLENLQYLFLSYNELTGPIPPELGSMPELLRLSVGSNELTGPIPASIGNLTKLQELDLDSNRLTGSIPPAIGNLSELTYLAIGSNDLSGPIPPSLWDLTKLVSLRMGLTRLTGSLPPAVGNLTNLELLTIHFTSMSGPLPPEIGRLEKLQYLFLARSGLTGRIPPELGNLRNLQVLIAWDNHLEGSLPPEIGQLENIEDLDLSSNRLSGPIPRELGNLVTLTNLELDQNALRGAIPFEITQLVNLRDGGGLMTGENALVIDDPAVRDFVARKDLFGLDTQQTVTPADVHVVETTDRSAEIGWTRIRHFGPGGYQVAARLTPGGPPVSVTTTEYLFEESAVVRNLQPQTTYFFTVAAVSLPSYTQKNLIISDPSPARTATTGPRVLAGPDVQVTEAPKGLIQIDEVPRNEDQFTLTNFGDLPTTVTFDFQKNFATFEPAGFQLEGGASQIVRVRSVPQPPGYYYGSLWTYGEGANNLIGISLLSAARPPGIVRAEALDSRVDVAGEPGSDSVGQARFRNVGTAPLTGILVSDQPWVVPDDSRVFIFPGSVGAATFRVIRSRRPPEAEGALVATLSLVYVDGSEFGFVRAKGDSPSGISVTKVTVVDVSRPATSASTIPPPGGVAFFVPGVTNFLRNQTSFFSDVSLLNNGRGSPVSDLRIYFTPASTQLTRVATLSPVPATTSVTLANILTTVYESAGGAGSLQIRSANWQNVVVQAKLIGLSERGSVSGEVPVFRSDRSVLAGA